MCSLANEKNNNKNKQKQKQNKTTSKTNKNTIQTSLLYLSVVRERSNWYIIWKLTYTIYIETTSNYEKVYIGLNDIVKEGEFVWAANYSMAAYCA